MCGGELTLSLLVSEHCARALHVCLQELRGCDQTGLLSWRQTRRLGFGTGRGAAADTRQILRKQQEGGTKRQSFLLHVNLLLFILIQNILYYWKWLQQADTRVCILKFLPDAGKPKNIARRKHS